IKTNKGLAKKKSYFAIIPKVFCEKEDTQQTPANNDTPLIGPIEWEGGIATTTWATWATHTRGHEFDPDCYYNARPATKIERPKLPKRSVGQRSKIARSEREFFGLRTPPERSGGPASYYYKDLNIS
ncbi:hypothetical protein V8F20_012874, partial [Naviculisporaceae sp. PSN 640]